MAWKAVGGMKKIGLADFQQFGSGASVREFEPEISLSAQEGAGRRLALERTRAGYVSSFLCFFMAVVTRLCRRLSSRMHGARGVVATGL